MNGVSDKTRHRNTSPLSRVLTVIAILAFTTLGFGLSPAFASTGGTWAPASGYYASGDMLRSNDNARQVVVQSTPIVGATSGHIVLNLAPPAGSTSYMSASIYAADNTCSLTLFDAVNTSGDIYDWTWPTSKCTGKTYGSVRAIVNGEQIGTFTPPTTVAPPPGPVGTGNTCTLSDVTLVRIARGAGFSETDIQYAVAIALAESGGRVNASHLNTNGSWDIGVWQINDAAHPSYDRNLLFTSPGYNAKAAKEIKTTAAAWTPWATYNSGAYAKFMTRAATALQAAPTGVLGGDSCSSMATSDLYDTTTADRPEDAGNDCHWTFNVFSILKCAFIPSQSAINGWQSKTSAITTAPPISIAVGAVNYGVALITIPDATWDTMSTGTASCVTCSGQEHGGVSSSGSPAGDIHFDPISEAAQYRVGTPGHGGALHTIALVLYVAAKAVIAVFFGWYWFNRLTSSVGGKGL